MFLKRFLPAFLLMLCLKGLAQSPDIDALEKSLQTEKESKKKTKILATLAQAYCTRDYKKALEYINKAVENAFANRDSLGIANSYNIKGIIWINLGENDKAVASLDSAVNWQKRIGNKLGLASSLGNMAVLYHQLGNYKRALECNYECLEIYEKLNNRLGIAQTLSNIASIDFMQKEFEKAGQGYKQVFEIYREINNRLGQANTLLNLAMISEKLGKKGEAITQFNRTILIYDSLKNDEGLASSYMGLGQLFKGQGEDEKALAMFLKAMSLYEAIGNNQGRTEALGSLGALYLKKEDYEKAIQYNTEFLKEAGKMRAKPYQKDAMENLAEAYAGMGNFTKAYGYQLLLSRIKDTLYNEERAHQISDLQVKYETQKKDQENLALLQKNEIYDLQLGRTYYLLTGSLALVILVVLFALLYLRQNKLSAKQKTVELEQKVLRSQMNPHFIFNSLIAIQSFIYRSDPKTAGDYLSDFARLMRLILEYSREEIIPIEREVKTLELYLKLQQLRFDSKFDFSIQVDESLSETSVGIPPMLAQPFIENSVEHGISKIDRQGMINVTFSKQDDFLKIIVTDNGLGISKAMELKKEKGHKSLATTITQERLDILNRGSKKKISLNIGDIINADGSIGGTKIEFGVPFKRL
jgi:tetratricopeptide (TPR) repeat protein